MDPVEAVADARRRGCSWALIERVNPKRSLSVASGRAGGRVDERRIYSPRLRACQLAGIEPFHPLARVRVLAF
jgi:hypothetical protein